MSKLILKQLESKDTWKIIDLEKIPQTNESTQFDWDLVVNWNLEVRWTTTKVNSTETEIKDPVITLNKWGTNADGVWFEIEEQWNIVAELKYNKTSWKFRQNNKDIANQEDVDNKADKVVWATNWNFAWLDSNWNLIDSWKKPSDYYTKNEVDNIANWKTDKVSTATENNVVIFDANWNIKDSWKNINNIWWEIWIVQLTDTNKQEIINNNGWFVAMWNHSAHTADIDNNIFTLSSDWKKLYVHRDWKYRISAMFDVITNSAQWYVWLKLRKNWDDNTKILTLCSWTNNLRDELIWDWVFNMTAWDYFEINVFATNTTITNFDSWYWASINCIYLWK